MKKIAISLGLTASLILAGQTFADNDDDERFIVRDVWTQKVRLADEADKDGDGQISREEYLEAPSHDFDELDENGDGYLDREERKGSGFSMRSEFDWDEEAHERLMAELDEQLAEVDEHIAEVMEHLEEMRFEWHGDFEFDGLDFRFNELHDNEDLHFSFSGLGARLMDKLDDNEDGQVSRDEFVNRRERLFDRLDENEDGILDEGELADLGLGDTYVHEFPYVYEFHSEDED